MNGNYNNRGSYQNNGNYNSQRNGYQGSRGSYNNTSAQKEQQNEKKFGAKFRLRGLVCTDKQSGEGFTRINTKSGTSMCSVNVMVSKRQKTNDRDRDGNPVWVENSEFFRLVAFGEIAEQVMGMVKAKSIMDFTGEIRMQKAENGFSNPSFVIEKVDMIREFSGSNSNNAQNGGQNNAYQRTNGQREDSQRGGYNNNGYQRNGGGYNYDERPNNYSQRSMNRNPQPVTEPENDYVETSDGNDIPF